MTKEQLEALRWRDYLNGGPGMDAQKLWQFVKDALLQLLSVLEANEKQVLPDKTSKGESLSDRKNNLAKMLANDGYSMHLDHYLKYLEGKDPRFFGLIDFSLKSSKKRFFVYDAENRTRKEYLVAHGVGSEGANDDGYAENFSNTPGSKKSSLGMYRVAETYVGKHGYSCMLDGLETTNDKARERAVVLHGADYVSDEYINRYGRIGRSEGCPAIEMKYRQEVIDALKNGSLLLIRVNV